MKQIPEIYHRNQVKHYSENIVQLKRSSGRLSLLRFIWIILILLAEIFLANAILTPPFHLLTILFTAGFIASVVYFRKVQKALRIQQAFLTIHQQELNFLETGSSDAFYDGSEFASVTHPYTHDLDIFGKSALYPFLCRAYTVTGRRLLANWLSEKAQESTIRERQQSIQELSTKPELAHEIRVHCLLGQDSASTLQHVTNWTGFNTRLTLASRILAYVLPASGLLTTLLLLINQDIFYFKLGTVFFILNLLCFSIYAKYIQKELGKVDNLSATFKGYAAVLEQLENEDWQSELLVSLRQKAALNGVSASKALHELASIIQSLDSVNNGFAMLLFNGTIQYHLHVFAKLLRWKQIYTQELPEWIQLIAETEGLLSISNYAFNNPDHAFPELNTDFNFHYTELGHPLIPSEKRVCNTVSFTEHPFVILTGSNMSGKSTFLRTVGIAIVMSNCGAPVCAKQATFTPIDLAASMRLSDSLTESASYFYAEVTRLEGIVQSLQRQPMFILLDEILRGTNSDDKKTGTIGVIEKVIQFPLFGIIATHDLEVCNTAYKHPQTLSNKCFEVEFIQEELHFDYTLRDGICKNKSATFIMTKHGII